MIVKKPLNTILFQNPFSESGFSRITEDVFGLTPMVIHRELLFATFFADALRIGEKPRNESSI
jgi:hypothetical protein